jgi:hypothetical protein
MQKPQHMMTRIAVLARLPSRPEQDANPVIEMRGESMRKKRNPTGREEGMNQSQFR